MTETLRIADETGANYYDLLNGPLRVRMGRYAENPRGALLERRYALTSHFTNDDERLAVMEAQKIIERVDVVLRSLRLDGIADVVGGIEPKR